MQTKPTDLTTLSTVLEKLRINRQDNEFLMTEKGFTGSNGKVYEPTDLQITKTYRFEGESNPSDSCILYVIEANDGLKGYSIDAYGAATNHPEEYDNFIREIPVADNSTTSE